MKPMKLQPMFIGVSAVLGLLPLARASSATWTGLGADALWTTTGNWSASPVPGAGDTATFNGAGNGKTTITTAPAALSSYVFQSGSAAYTISASSTTWSVPNGGGVTIQSGVSATQDLSGIQFIRPVSGTTASFVNQGSGLLKLGTIFNSNTVNGNAVVKFAPTTGATIEIISLKTIDNGSIAGRTTTVLLDDDGILKFSGSGNYSGTDAEGNTVTLHRGTLSTSTVNNVADTARSGIGRVGRVQFGEAAQTRTATLQYTGTTASTDRPFYILDRNTARFDVNTAATNLSITSVISQSAATNGGGGLAKAGDGTLTLSNANTFTGETVISGGKIALGNALALQYSAYDTTGSTGAIGLDVTGFATPTLGGLKGSVNLATAITGYSGVSSLTLNPQTGKSNLYSGEIGDGAAGMSLIKTGAGTQILTGDNKFTGNVTVSAGRLTLGHSNALGTGAKGLIMQGTGRSLYLTGGITLPANIDMFVSSSSADGAGIHNESGDNEILSPINISTGNPALNISSGEGSLKISGDITPTTSNRTLFFGGASLAANEIAGSISDGGLTALPVTKQGSGTWILSGDNSYTGTTSVNAGKLVVNGNISTSLLTTVNNNATLGGTGTVGDLTVANGGTLAPGNSPGTLNVEGTLVLNSTSILAFELNPSNTTVGGTINDLITGVTSLTLDGLLNVTATSGSFSSLTSGTWRLIEYSGDLSNNTLALGSMPTLGAGYSWWLDVSTASQVNLSIIPEPSSFWPGALGLTLLLVRRRR